MSWKVEISPSAEKDLEWFRTNDRQLYLKCFDLTRNTAHDPFHGLGKPEPLKHLGPNIWSRRINLEHRMVYTIAEGFVVVSAYRFHY